MPLLKVEAEKLSQDQVVQGIVEEIFTTNEMYNMLPFTKVSGKAYLYKREGTLATVDYLDVNEVVPENASTFKEVTTKLRILIGDVDVDKFMAETMSDTEDQLGVQIALKAKSMARAFQKSVVNGDSSVNEKEFDGLKALVTAEQTIEAGVDGGALTLSALDHLVDSVPNGGPDFLMMRSGTRRAYVAQLRAAGGNTGAMIQHPNFDVPVLAHNGCPIIINDFMPGDELMGSNSSTCSVYAVRANELDGLHGLYGGASAGIRVETIGTVQNKDAIRTRLKWYCGLALKSTKSLARLAGVTNV
ncbi:phage capsid protein [Comamonas thiooxydans]|uniref:major capsid protein n=1 Tax=Comamonas thiooxydans TaxID=363952 RepID=UPI0007C491C4|nr:phage major capsid protein [Comamonas thiooxydans]OAD82878.1 phage capsid protein [Comamonas thiooxydans]